MFSILANEISHLFSWIGIDVFNICYKFLISQIFEETIHTHRWLTDRQYGQSINENKLDISYFTLPPSRCDFVDITDSGSSICAADSSDTSNL